MKKWLLAAVCGSVFAPALFGADAPARQMPKAVVAVAPAQIAENVSTRRYSAQVVSPAVVHLVPRVSGELLEIGFHDGDMVKKGQKLYRFDALRYEAAVKAADANIAECKARLEYAQNSYERTNTLYRSQATSKDTLENTQSVREALQSAMLAAEAARTTALDDLKNTVIVAPMDGVIGVTKFTVGNYITPANGELCTINQIDPVRVSFAISNRDFLQLFGNLDTLKKEAQLALTLADDSAYPEPGKIELIDNTANRRTDTIQVYALFPNKEHKLIPGSTVSLKLMRKTGQTYPSVNPAAVMQDADQSYVYVVDESGKVARANVVTGNDLGDKVIITQGLKNGDKVIIDGMHKVQPGAEVEIAK